MASIFESTTKAASGNETIDGLPKGDFGDERLVAFADDLTGTIATEDHLSPPDPSMAHKLVMGTAVVLPFLGVLAALVLVWNSLAMGWLYASMVVVGWFLTATGITIGFHRLCSHRSFETYPWVRTCWMALGRFPSKARR